MPSMKCAGLAIAIGLCAASTVWAQAPPQAPASIVLTPLKPNVWVGVGGGGNSTVIAGNTGVIVVDAKQTEAGAKDLLAQIAAVTPKPVTTVVLTHSDGDHVNGLVAFPAGVKVIAHENDKKELEAALAAGGRGAPPADRLPTQVITGQKTAMTIDGVKLEFHHWAPAHTSGDLIVFLVDQKVAATGDIIVTNRADDNPNIHFEKNGSTAGWIETVKGLIGLHAETYVTGHGTLLKQADLERKLAATTERRNKIAAMIKAGKTLDEIKAALPDAPAPGAAPPGGPQPGRAGGGNAGAPGGGARGGTPPLTFVDIAYRELGGK